MYGSCKLSPVENCAPTTVGAFLFLGPTHRGPDMPGSGRPANRRLSTLFANSISGSAMKRKKLNVKHLWKQFEDFLFPRLRLSITDRAVYSHLIRHSRLEGRPQLRFSIPCLPPGTPLPTGPLPETAPP